MKTTEQAWIGRVLQSRAHGSTYILVAMRGGPCEFNGVRYSWGYYGRSQQGGGHKHKAYAHDAKTGAIYRTRDMLKRLATIRAEASAAGGAL